MEKISLEVFGTEDYNSVLEIMAPSDTLVKLFWDRCRATGYLDAGTNN